MVKSMERNEMQMRSRARNGRSASASEFDMWRLQAHGSAHVTAQALCPVRAQVILYPPSPLHYIHSSLHRPLEGGLSF